MKRLIKRFFFPSSLRINLIVIIGTVLLLVVSLGVLFYFSRQALHREAKLDAEQTLEGTVRHVDNILLSVEQTVSNVSSEMTLHLNQPGLIGLYCRRLVESNPNIVGCAVCFKPNYYPGRELFMTYVHHKGGVVKKDSKLITSDKYGTKPYTEYPWYTQPMTTGKTCWTDPLPNEEDEGVTLSFCKPITDGKQQLVGVVVADVSVRQLSDIVLSAQSTSNNYTVLLGSNGSFIVHPDQLNLLNETVFTQPEKSENSSIQEAAKAMLNGETGYLPFEQNGEDWYVFYKPFQQAKTPNRSMERINWSIGVVYSEAAAFGHYNHLLMLVVVIAVAGLLLLWLLCRLVIHRQLKSLRQLTHVTQRIAEGHYDDPMPDIRRNDEIGQLYDHLKEMSKSLAAHVKELNLLTGQLKNRREVMYEIYAKERSVDRVMSSFLHFVTNQMIAPTQDVKRYVEKLCTSYRSFAPEEVGHIVSTINRKSDSIIELINNTLDTADSHHLGDSEAGKEADHD